MSAKLKTITLGCKVNQYETELVREGLATVGYESAAENEQADLCIVNTCTVTADGDAKSRQAIRRLARENPNSRIVVMGCYATRAPEEVSSLPNVAEVVLDKRELPDLLGRHGVIDIPTGISGFANHRRAFVKVQDGCLLNCSYCIIPAVRPYLASRPLEHIESEAQRLIANGYKEIVLTGIHLGHYGVEWNRGRPKHEWIRLAHLVRRLASLPGEFRVRLSSIEATEVTRELVATMAEFPEKICPHLHVCLQSGSNNVLRRMRRRWGVERFVDRCRLVQESLDCPAFTTDVIVGFPGETDADFEATCRVVRDLEFSKVHVFSFSARRGTPAATMPHPVPPPIIAARRKRLLEVEAETRRAYYQRLVGRELQVLIEARESATPGHVLGTGCRYATVDLPGTTAEHGQLIRVVGENVTGETLRARRI